MTSAYNSVKGAVVSVINLKRQSSSSTNSLYNSLFGDDEAVHPKKTASLKPTVKVQVLST